jgi:hypothetical protein
MVSKAVSISGKFDTPHRPPRLDVLIEVRRVRGEHHRAAPGVSPVTICSPAVQSPTLWRRMPGHTSRATLHDPDLVSLVQRHQPRQGVTFADPQNAGVQNSAFGKSVDRI